MTNIPPSPSGLRGAVDLSSLVNRPSAPEGQAPVAGSLVFEATDASFGEVLELSRTVPVVVDLWAEWCGPCKQLTPILEKLVAEYAGRVVLAKVDVDQNPQLAQAFQAQSIPLVVAVVAGQPVQLFTGALPEQEVRQVFEQLLELAAQNGVTGTLAVGETETDAAEPAPAPLPPLHQEAYDAIERGDYAAAITAYRTAIAQNPADGDAVAGLAQVSLLHRLHGRTLDEIRARAAAAPGDLDAQLDVADLDLSGGHVEDAFDRLLTLFPTLDAEGKNRVRERLLELFEVVGPEDATVGAARRRLTNLLY